MKTAINKPLITVITVVYNDADNLAFTLKSVAEQQYKDFEFLVIDGNSTDRTLDVIRQYENIISTWISEPDKGIYDAMNKGIKMAKGEYINFLNAGDAYCYADTLHEVTDKLLQNSDVDILYGKLMNHSNGEQNLKYITGEVVSEKSLYVSIPITHQTMFVRRHLFGYIGLYSTKLRIVSDYEWFVKYYDKVKSFNKLLFFDKPLIVYQQGGFSFQNMRKVAFERIKVARKYSPMPYKVLHHLNVFSLIIKSYLIPVVIKLKIFDVYRGLKYRKRLA
jgi:glycosyltransferase involved in cell wall biosynthesis